MSTLVVLALLVLIVGAAFAFTADRLTIGGLVGFDPIDNYLVWGVAAAPLSSTVVSNEAVIQDAREQDSQHIEWQVVFASAGNARLYATPLNLDPGIPMQTVLEESVWGWIDQNGTPNPVGNLAPYNTVQSGSGVATVRCAFGLELTVLGAGGVVEPNSFGEAITLNLNWNGVLNPLIADAAGDILPQFEGEFVTSLFVQFASTVAPTP